MPGALAGKVALVAGATRGAGRGIAVALGAAGATVYGTGRRPARERSEYDRPETIEETAELVDRSRRHGHRGAGRPPRAGAGRGAGRAHRRRARSPRRPRQRHLGRRRPRRLGRAGLGARPRRRPAHPAPGDRHPHHHQPLRAAAADPRAGRPGGRGHRRHRRVQRRELPRLVLLRPGQDVGDPAGLRPGARSCAASAAPPSR